MRRLTLLFGLVLVCSLVLLLSAPLILSTPWGREQLVSSVNRSIPGSISIQKLKLSWFSHQQIERVELRDPEGRVVIAIDQITSDLRLYQLLSRVPSLSNTRVTGLKGDLIQDRDGLTNLHHALGLQPADRIEERISTTAKTPEDVVTIRLPFIGVLNLVDSELKWRGHVMDPLVVSNVNLIVQSSSREGPLQLLFNGQSQQRDLRGSFLVKGLVEGFDHRGELRLEKSRDGWLKLVGAGKVQTEVSVKQLAVDVIDRLWTFHDPRFSGIVSEAIGPQLDLQLQQSLSQEGLTLTVKANSKQMMASMATEMRDGKMSLRQPGELQWTVTPRFIARLMAMATDATPPLLQPTGDMHIQATLEGLELVPDEAAGWLAAPIRLRWQLQNDQKSITSPWGGLIITDCWGSFERSARASTWMSQMVAKVQWGQEPKTEVSIQGEWDTFFPLQGQSELAVTQLPAKFFRLWSPGLAASLGSPIDLTTRLQVKDCKIIAMDAEVAPVSVMLDSQDRKYGTQLSNLHLHVEGAEGLWDMQASADLTPNRMATPWSALVGTSLKGTLVGQLDRKMVGWVEARLNSDLMDFLGHAQLSEAGQFSLIRPAVFHYRLEPGVLDTAGLQVEHARLTAPAQLEGVIETLQLPINAFSLATLQMTGHGTIDTLCIHDSSTGHSALCQDLATSWSFDGSKQEMSGSLQGQSSIGKAATGNLKVMVTARGWAPQAQLDWTQATVKAKGSLVGFPVAMVSAASGLAELPLLIGPKLDVYFTAVLTPEQGSSRGQAEFSLSGEGISAGFAVQWLDTHQLVFKENSTALQWQLTPKRFATIQRLATGKPPSWAIAQPTMVDIKVPHWNIPTKQDWTHLGLAVQATLAPAKITYLASGVTSSLEGLQLSLDSRNLTERLTLSLSGSDLSLRIDGRLAAQQLVLRQPLVLEGRLEPGISQSLLSDLLPLFQTAIRSEGPMRLTVDPVNFSMPLRGVSLENVHIGAATLELGRISFHNTGPLASVVSLLDRSKSSVNDQFPVQFTPLYFSLMDGILRLERVDVQIADKYPIAIWGKVDFHKDSVNMAIGVTNKALQVAYGLDNLEPNAMLLLSLSGTTGNASIDKAKAAARVTSLVAQSKGGASGMIIGGVLDLLSGGMNDSHIRPPTSPPPWETEADRVSSSASESTAQPLAPTPLDKIQKGIERGASKLFKMLGGV